MKFQLLRQALYQECLINLRLIKLIFEFPWMFGGKLNYKFDTQNVLSVALSFAENPKLSFSFQSFPVWQINQLQCQLENFDTRITFESKSLLGMSNLRLKSKSFCLLNFLFYFPSQFKMISVSCWFAFLRLFWFFLFKFRLRIRHNSSDDTSSNVRLHGVVACIVLFVVG